MGAAPHRATAVRPLWRGEHWRLYRVAGARPLGVGAMGGDWFELAAPTAGAQPVAIRFNRHWSVAAGAGCVRQEDGWTVVEAEESGPIRVESNLVGERCSG